MRAGDVINGDDGVLLDTTFVRGEGRAPDFNVTRSAWIDELGNIYFVGYIWYYPLAYTVTCDYYLVLPTGLHSHV